MVRKEDVCVMVLDCGSWNMAQNFYGTSKRLLFSHWNGKRVNFPPLKTETWPHIIKEITNYKALLTPSSFSRVGSALAPLTGFQGEPNEEMYKISKQCQLLPCFFVTAMLSRSHRLRAQSNKTASPPPLPPTSRCRSQVQVVTPASDSSAGDWRCQ